MSDNFTHEYVTATHMSKILGLGPGTVIRWCNDPYNPIPCIKVQRGFNTTIFAIRPGDMAAWLELNRGRLMGKHLTYERREYIKKWLKEQKAASNG